jgi:nucleoside-diphosphate kinase
MHLTADEAEEFYAEHKGRPFLPELVEFMTSGPVVVLVLEKDQAILGWRELMGATDPAQAAEGTVRKLFGTNKGSNASHGSDSATSAAREIDFFFPAAACCG